MCKKKQRHRIKTERLYHIRAKNLQCEEQNGKDNERNRSNDRAKEITKNETK